MRVLVTGSSGLVGSHLMPALAADGHVVTRLVRSAPRHPNEYRWVPAAGTLDPAALRDCEAVVHLAGASIAGGRWSRHRKQLIRDSRVMGTGLLCAAIARSVPGPRVIVSSSGIGIYGDRGDEVLTEESGPGQGFLVQVAQEWEAAAQPARDAGARVVHLRQGMVLDREGGALPRLALPFRWGVGGRLGNGRQWLSWIAIDDLVRVIRHALVTAELVGPINAVAPEPVTNAELARTLARVLHRPALLPAPGFALKLLLGQMGEELLLFSQRARPARLEQAGFQFAFADLDSALQHIFRRLTMDRHPT